MPWNDSPNATAEPRVNVDTERSPLEDHILAATLDQTIKDEIVKLHDRGMEPADIARQLGVGHNAVHATLRDRELEQLREIVGPLLTPAEIAKLEIHEWCYAYPEMSEEDLDALGDRIREDKAEDGKLESPILVWRHDGKPWIIDGRNRSMAARNKGVRLGPADYRVVECDEAAARDKVETLNEHRRHLTPREQETYRARRAMKALDMAREAGNGRVTRDARAAAAKEHGVSTGNVAAAKQIADAAPEVADRMRKGEVSIPDAREEAGLNRRHVTRTEPERKTTLEEFTEEYEERAASSEGDSDEEWVKSLGLYAKLSGKKRDAFVRDAVAYRHLKAARKAWGAAVAGELKSNRQTPAWLSRQQRALAIAGPEHWDLCASEDGGCDGEGAFVFGDKDERCENCRGYGYIPK